MSHRQAGPSESQQTSQESSTVSQGQADLSESQLTSQQKL